jgi:hypothetical protein
LWGWLIAGVLAALLPADARAWGLKGHHVVARIAFRHLTPRTDAAIANLLHADPDDREACAQLTSREDKLACVSTWADDVKKIPPFDSTGPLHFVNVPIYAPPSERHYDAARDCADRRCAVAAIDDYRAVLADAAKGDRERCLALKFVVHFVGDVHQPLHTVKDHDLDAANRENHGSLSDKGDRGGNLKLVTWLGQTTTPFGCWNLHAVWDDGIIAQSPEDEAALADALDGALTAPGSSELHGGPAEWANEAVALAVDVAYRLPDRQTDDRVCEVPNGEKADCDLYDPTVCRSAEVHYRYRLGNAYLSQTVATVRTQLTRAGVRLARFLNDVFDPPR